jgi:uncharacterized RDD family membrane protein YckC
MMPQYGGFWIRVVAYIIDTIILGIGKGIASVVVGLTVTPFAQTSGWNPYGAGFALNLAISLFGSWLYYALMESSSLQASLGKMALGLAVTDEFGRRIGFGRATGRYFAKFLSSFALLIGFMMVGWTARKQGLHDMIAGTLVYKTRNPQEIGFDVEAFR